MRHQVADGDHADAIHPATILDTVGLYCPVPIIKTAERMKAMRTGEVLEVLSDDRVILVDLPAWCRSTGNEFLGAEQDGTEHRLWVRKTAGRAARTDARKRDR